MRRMRLLFLLAVVFAFLTAGIAKVRELAPYTPPVPDVPLVVTALLPAPTLTLAPTATPPIVRTVKPAQPVATVKADPVVQVIVTAQPGLNVRDAPAGHIVGSLRTGAVLAVKSGAEWAEVVSPVDYQGKYVSAKYLRAK